MGDYMSTLRVNTIQNAAGTGPTSTIQSGTAQNATSGTFIDFTGIPAGVKRVTVIFNGVSTNGTSAFLLQCGSGSITATGYLSQAWGSVGTGVITTGLCLTAATAAAVTFVGHCVLTHIGGNTWVSSGSMGLVDQTSTGVQNIGKTPALSGPLDRLRITTVNGTDTFDAGSVNILYES